MLELMQKNMGSFVFVQKALYESVILDSHAGTSWQKQRTMFEIVKMFGCCERMWVVMFFLKMYHMNWEPSIVLEDTWWPK